MIFPEEDHAKHLHKVLRHQSMLRGQPFQFEVSGAGVHWKCQAIVAHRMVTIHCFDVQNLPEYYAEFCDNAQACATARTPSLHEVTASTFDWLEGENITELHANYPLVDGNRRALDLVHSTLLRVAPSIHEASIRMRPIMCDLHELWLEKEERAVKVNFRGKNSSPDFTLYWDGCVMSESRLDDLVMAARIVESWLVKAEAPHAMRSQFPEITLGKVADFYAAGRPIEGEFLESWDKIEAFCARNQWPGKQTATEFVAALRRAGYDRTLRAGQSLCTIVLSRSRQHGLRPDQPCLTFSFTGTSIEAETLFGKSGERPSLNPATTASLDQLVATPID